MKNPNSSWWELHLRKCRGESLTAAEQEQYESELAVQDQPVAVHNLEHLKQLRLQVATAENENDQLRNRIVDLEKEIQSVEQALSQRTRKLIGVPE